MAIYAIYSSAPTPDPERAFESARVAKTGFSSAALLFGPLWLLWRGLWIALGVWVAGAAIIEVLTRAGILAPGGASMLYALATLLIGLEGRHWQGAALEASGRPLRDIVEARDADEAARAFFNRALTASAPPPIPRARQTPPAAPHVLGLFPEASL